MMKREGKFQKPMVYEIKLHIILGTVTNPMVSHFVPCRLAPSFLRPALHRAVGPLSVVIW